MTDLAGSSESANSHDLLQGTQAHHEFTQSTGPRDRAQIVVLSANLMDRGRFRHLGPVTFVTADVELRSAAKAAVLIFADLSVPGAISALRTVANERDAEQPMKVIGYAGHVEKDLLNAARELPGVEALPRSVFFKRLANTSVPG